MLWTVKYFLSKRICFEPVQEDERFNFFVSSPPWRDLKVILYELRENILFNDNALSEDMYALDMMFFLISMHQVDDVNREKVLNYISKINDSLGLPPVIIFESGRDFGKAVRSLIPAYVELQYLREKKCRALCKKMLETLELTVRNEIENLERVNTIELKKINE